MALELLHAAIEKLSSAPPLRQLRRVNYDRHFIHNEGMNLFKGVFETYDEAAANVPENQGGYDAPEAARMYETWLEPFSYDYPPFFWLLRSFGEGLRTVCDLGGNVGIKFFAFREVGEFPPEGTWTVVDLPAIVSHGADFAAGHGSPAPLRFATSLEAAGDFDVLYASGSLQYIPQTLAQMLAARTQRPRRVIVNITPVHETRGFFTVNSFGAGFAAYRVQQRDELISSVEAVGYQLRDQWINPNKRLSLPFEAPELSLDHYSGFCFDTR